MNCNSLITQQSLVAAIWKETSSISGKAFEKSFEDGGRLFRCRRL